MPHMSQGLVASAARLIAHHQRPKEAIQPMCTNGALKNGGKRLRRRPTAPPSLAARNPSLDLKQMETHHLTPAKCEGMQEAIRHPPQGTSLEPKNPSPPALPTTRQMRIGQKVKWGDRGNQRVELNVPKQNSTHVIKSTHCEWHGNWVGIDVRGEHEIQFSFSVTY